MKYAEWRRQLHEIQLEIDAYDESFDWAAWPTNDEAAMQEYKKNRKELTDKLEAHYQKEALTFE